MSKIAGPYVRSHEWVALEMERGGRIRWITSTPARRDRKVSVFGKAQPLRTTRGRHNLMIWFIQFQDRPSARREFVESLQAQMDEAMDRCKTPLARMLEREAG
jgi:hypothetical protein